MTNGSVRAYNKTLAGLQLSWTLDEVGLVNFLLTGAAESVEFSVDASDLLDMAEEIIAFGEGPDGGEE